MTNRNFFFSFFFYQGPISALAWLPLHSKRFCYLLVCLFFLLSELPGSDDITIMELVIMMIFTQP
jgi:hypothetical protein